MDDAEIALNYFLRNFRKYVMPDMEKEGVNKLIELQKEQTRAMAALSEALSVSLPEGLKNYLEPHF